MARILLFGQAQFGARVFAGLAAAGHEVIAACPPPDREGRAADPLKEAAEAAGVAVIQRKSYKGSESYEAVQPRRADLCLLAYVTQIIPVEILDAPRFASLCFHPSLLPRYRGGSAINWQLINGETQGGITLFRPDSGVDAGPVYSTKTLDIGADESAGSYYYASVFEPSVAAMLEVTELILAGDADAVAQDESAATHQPLCRDQHAVVDWARPTRELHNLIRGCDPSPGAYCVWRDTKLRLYGSRRVADARLAPPGTIVAVGDEGVEVATADGSLRLTKLGTSAGKQAAAAAAADIGLGEGDRLGC